MGFYNGELELDQLLESIGIGNNGWEPGYTCRMPKQKEFMADQHFGCSYIGGEGSGKSVSLMGTCIINCMADPNGITLVGRLNLPALTATTMQTFLELVDADNGEPYGLNGNTPMWTFPNGHKVLFRHLDIDDPKVGAHIRSLNLSAAFVDEQCEVSEEVFFIITGRLRRKTAIRRIYRGSSNPAGHDWQWRTFFDPNRKAEFKRDYHGITASSMENVYLPAEYHQRRLALYPRDWADRFIYGHFSDFTDLIYKEFTEPSHVWDDSVPWEVFGNRPTPPVEWPVIIGVDIGGGEEGDPWAIGLISVAPNGYLYKFGEVYGSDLRIAPIAEQIWSQMEGRQVEGLAYDYAQRAAAIELEDYNLGGTPALKEVKPGLFKMAQYLHVDPRYIHPFNPAVLGSPKLFVAKSCVNTIREYSGYKWAKDRSGNPKNEPSHENSHSPDSDRYAIHTFRPLPQDVKAPKKWEHPDLPIMSKVYWQAKELNDERQKQLVRLSRTPFFSIRSAVQQKQMEKLHTARVI